MMVFSNTRRITEVINNTGSTALFFDQVLEPGQIWEIVDRKLEMWRDDPSISGAITSGTLGVRDGTKEFGSTTTAFQYFYNNPGRRTTVNWPENSLFTLVSGVDEFGNVDYNVQRKAITGIGLTVTSGTEGIELVVTPPNAIVGGGGTTVTSGTSTTTISGEDFVKTVTVVTSGSIVVISGENVTISGIGGVAVEVDASGEEPVITVSGEPLPTTSGQVIGDDYLTINRARFGYGKNGNVHGAYLRVEGAASTETGHVMVRPARMTGVAAYYPDGAADKRFEVRKNGISTALGEYLVYEGVPMIEDNLSIDFDTGDRVQVFVTASGSSIKDPNFWMEVAWRALA